ncbi:MAG: sulfatase-like hydrolase/transferase [Anaerolineales bacterium]|jgi:arylsulfatase A-like enzyme
MNKKITRREFLKLTSLIPAVYYLPRFNKRPPGITADSNSPNILIIVFDALSAMNISFMGYQRNTMPYLSQLVERATVYHNHYAGGNYTTPGTASLLTGTYPITNRGITRGKPMDKEFVEKNIFHLFNQHYRLTYSHNPFVNTLQNQFADDLDLLKNRRDLYLKSDWLISELFKNDEDIATLCWVQGIKKKSGYAYSILLSFLYQQLNQSKLLEQYFTFPRGLPYISENSYYILEDAIDWTYSELSITPQPFLGYFHYLPPHKPYLTRKEFTNAFKGDGLEHIKKINPINQSESIFRGKRRWYDEFILYVDAEFKRLFDLLETSGILENTWIFFTSDHGEMFERGVQGHMSEMLYQPLVKIPLIIFEPGQTTRRDIYTPTSAVDILPTLLHINGKVVPDWCEGEVLPPYQTTNEKRSIFAYEAKENGQFDLLTKATAMIIKDHYKFISYFGYKQLNGSPLYEFFNLERDPEELNNLYHPDSITITNLLDELNMKIDEANQRYQD